MSIKTKDVADAYDRNYGIIRRWVARNPGATAWMGVGGTVVGFLVGLLF